MSLHIIYKQYCTEDPLGNGTFSFVDNNYSVKT